MEQFEGRRKLVVQAACLFFILAPLFLYKYSNFLIQSCLCVDINFDSVSLVHPIGISFFTFQAIGYLTDVYRGHLKCEHNFADFALFLSFFPQQSSGPISKGEELLPQIKTQKSFDTRLFSQGIKYFIWGLFMKLVVADRLAMYVDVVYDNLSAQSGKTCLLAVALYSFQIYGDFAGYSLMAIGVAATLGYRLINNFNCPYFSTSISEFWRAWHISLTRWLTSYVYISLGGNRCSKFRQYLNILMTFFVSGLWHGANWTFVLWGGLHGLFQVIEKMVGLDPKGKLCPIVNRSLLLRCLMTLVTFSFISFAWIFFRMPSVEMSYNVITKILCEFDGPLYLPNGQIVGKYMVAGVLILVLKEVYERFFSKSILKIHPLLTVIWFIFLSFSILLIGVLDSGQFIYVSF